jgi:hypothetical protein
MHKKCKECWTKADQVALLHALSKGIIPGMPPALRVQIVTQVDASVGHEDKDITVLQHVLDGDAERKEAERLKTGESVFITRPSTLSNVIDHRI